MKLEGLSRYIIGFNGFDEFGNDTIKLSKTNQERLFCYSHKFLHCISSSISGRMGFHNVQSYRFTPGMASGTLLQYHDFLSRMAGQKCFHSCHHRNI
jgi:hypothetical protein